MKDLEIRGAGNLLGGEQSGHIAGVGFDLYVRLVGEAVASFRGDTDDSPTEIKIELPVDAHLPHDYVPHERLRLEMYKKLAAVADEAQLGRHRGRARRPLRRAARAGAQPARGRPPAHGGPGRRHRRHQPAGQPRAVRPARAAREPGAAPPAPLPALDRQARARHHARPEADDGPVAGRPLRDREVLAWAGDVIRSVVMDNVGQAARVATARS